MKNYDFTKPSKYILYFDTNNFYNWGTSQYLPYSGFMWLNIFYKFDVNSISEKSLVGYILDVDLEYPNKVHKLQKYYLLTPEKLAIPYDMLSDYSKTLQTNMEEKLVV